MEIAAYIIAFVLVSVCVWLNVLASFAVRHDATLESFQKVAQCNCLVGPISRERVSAAPHLGAVPKRNSESLGTVAIQEDDLWQSAAFKPKQG